MLLLPEEVEADTTVAVAAVRAGTGLLSVENQAVAAPRQRLVLL
jgi:hypothetical protein